ncbi:cell-cycle control medial ring component [Cryomyces antarcticus]
MTEISFAKSFLSALDSRPVKLSSDHVSDPKKHPSQSAYILPKMPTPMPKRRKLSSPTDPSSPGADPASSAAPPTTSVTLNPMRAAAAQPVTLASQALSTSIHAIKTLYAAQTGTSVDKIKLLLHKKPCADSKTLKELLPDGDADAARALEFGVMLLGGAGFAAAKAHAEPKPNAADVPVTQGATGGEALQSEAFWEDLKGFLVQRLRDEAEGERVAGLFRKAVL